MPVIDINIIEKELENPHVENLNKSRHKGEGNKTEGKTEKERGIKIKRDDEKVK